MSAIIKNMSKTKKSLIVSWFSSVLSQDIHAERNRQNLLRFINQELFKTFLYSHELEESDEHECLVAQMRDGMPEKVLNDILRSVHALRDDHAPICAFGMLGNINDLILIHVQAMRKTQEIGNQAVARFLTVYNDVTSERLSA